MRGVPRRARKARRESRSLETFTLNTLRISRGRDKKRADADAKLKQQGGPGTNGSAAPTPTQADLDAMRPAKIAVSYKNGVDGAQLLAVSKGTDALLTIAPTGVQAGAWNRGQPIDIPATAYFSFAQAEYFYDCSGKWEATDCNGADLDGAGAMWHFRWRARLRRLSAKPRGAARSERAHPVRAMSAKRGSLRG